MQSQLMSCIATGTKEERSFNPFELQLAHYQQTSHQSLAKEAGAQKYNYTIKSRQLLPNLLINLELQET